MEKILKKISKKMLKKMLSTALFIFVGVTAAHASPIHTHTTGFPISRGVYYQQNRHITSAGIVDVHVITVHLDYPGLTLGPVTPSHGDRDTTTNMLQYSGAVGGINADFFNMSLNPGTSYGQLIQNGLLLEMNRGGTSFATFLMDIYNTPLIEYVQADIIFLNDGIRNLTIQGINKIEADPISATIFDQHAIYNTAGIDSRQEGLVKVVVEDGVITHISYPGELVYVPYNGFIIALAESYAYYFTESVLVGHSAELYIEANVDMDMIWQAIGGGSIILEHGELSTTGYIVAPNARHPRSAIGFNQMSDTVFLVAVDGRGTSIGATHEEMATILLELGAYRAMHFDGGGSTTLGLRTPREAYVRAINTFSDEAQRRVVNALGVFNNAPVGELTGIDIRTFPNRVFVGDALHVYPVGLDAHLNNLVIDSAFAHISSVPMLPREGNRFFPTIPGTFDINLAFGIHNATVEVEVLDLAQIVPNMQELELDTGESISLAFTGLSPLGHRGPLNVVRVDIMPIEVGTFYNGVFTAGTESGVIRASVGTVATYIGVNVNEQGHISHPASHVSRNPYRAFLDPHEPGFDITVVGNTSVEPFFDTDDLNFHVQIRNNALHNFMRGSNLGVFSGPTEIEGMENLPTLSWTSNYSFHNLGNGAAVISLNAERGSLTGTSPYNWSFVREIAYFEIEHVIILVNRQMYTLPAHEQQMFRHALEQMATQRSIFVISSTDAENSSVIENGVNYINLSGLFHEEEVNDNFQILRLRIYQGNITFDMQNVFY
ncbi:MAG: phosphodiester glycosidase family protein [Defluviitaleaceae bacterium]|nr:phosphodiester glycosidase family protein [Defluviitaleaceae bacterium]